MANYPYPESVFRYFDEIARIPHGSGNTAGIRKWALETAAQLGIEAYADDAGNVILKKSASAGYESHPGVILQGHLDMVCAKLPNCEKDMDTEGPDLVWNEDFLSANGTTLGGDDGIAIAYAFAVLESDGIAHPPLTVILTVDEETGMDGAAALSPDALRGSYLLNLDSEEEGIFTVGCAGGVRSHLTYPVSMTPQKGTRISFTLSGLTGGHSGSEIHRNLLNANVTMLRLLRTLDAEIMLTEFSGGVRDNVIPTECIVRFLADPKDDRKMIQAAEQYLVRLRAEHPEEPGMSLEISVESDFSADAVPAGDSARLLACLDLLPNGVQEMNYVLHMPQTSLNLGIFRLDEAGMHVDALLRSGFNSEKDALAAKLRKLADQAGGSVSESGSYPAWEYVPDTELEQTAVRVFTEQYGKAPVIQTIHAGLECGILAAKAPSMQCLSIGPDLFDIHTPRERLSLASAARVWEFLMRLLAAL